MSPSRIGVYPGTFDPVTRGHLDVISRATRTVDRLIVAVAVNIGKDPLFTLDERAEMVRRDIALLDKADADRVEVRPFDTLLMHFVDEVGAKVVVRGLRAVSDFEYEFQMASMNSRLNPKVETIFLMAADKYQFISSRFVKEIGRLGGDVSQFVSAGVKERLDTRFAEQKRAEGKKT